MSIKNASTEIITNKILIIRGRKVMLSPDLAELYQVEVRTLIQAVKRNQERFPEDFMFQLTWEEAESSRSQFVILKKGHNIKYLPYAFTEQGVAMLSSVLKSRKAVLVNIAIMRAFVAIREALVTHKELALKLRELEGKVGNHDKEIRLILEAIQQLLKEEEKPKKEIGFHVR